MPISNDFSIAPMGLLWVTRESRQRRIISTDGLKDSIANVGILNPIIIRRTGEVVAGERRWTCAKELSLSHVPVRYIDELDEQELQIVELEENLKRQDLHWKDEVQATARLHAAYCLQDPSWTMLRTAGALSIQNGHLSRILRVARDINSPKIAQATGLMTAYNMLMKVDSRKADTAFSEIMEGVGAGMAAAEARGQAMEEALAAAQEKPQQTQTAEIETPQDLTPATIPAVPQAPVPAQLPAQAPAPAPSPAKTILNESFLSWAPTYSGPKFNLIHCDFPYGIGAFDGAKGATGANSSSDMGEGGMAQAKAKLYDDSPEVYWELLDCFARHLDNFMAHSAHVMFWFSMHHYERTLEFLSREAPCLKINPIPLVWMKSDNKGVLPDPKRGPRHVYETALMMSREDRFILRPVANAYASPSDKTYHHSTKPEPMLKHFLGMMVDETTSLLDPTCGGGSAIRAAESLGAKATLGLEISPEHCETARGALRKFRVLR